MNTMIITSTQKLKEVCDRFSKYPFITLDTEFIREKTYYPVLCLIQMGSQEDAYCIDPLADGLDLKPLFDLLQNPQVIKVFHAARQDIEIFYHMTGQMPAPLFDTQVAAMVCGFGDSASYQQLVQELTGISLDKSMRYTDWSKRPLDEKQVSYALCDVTHLVDVYLKICETLKANHRYDWLAEEMAVVNNPETYETNDETIWQKMKCPLTKPQQVHTFAKLCAWREKTAKTKNRPRRHILKDDALLELAVAHPQTLEELDDRRSLPSGFSKSSYAPEIMAVIKQARADSTKMYSLCPKRKPLSSAQKNLAELMRLLLNIVSDDLAVAPKVIASSEDLADLITDNPACALLKGWRYDAFGKKAQALKKGRLSFAFDPKKNKVVLLEKE